jgi:uncharacterized cupin superfamily protein
MSKINIAAATISEGSDYPAPFDIPCRGRVRRALGNVAKLTQFGVNLTHLPPGAWSAQRHWHSAEDEFVWVLEGELVLITDKGEEILHVGECAGFKAGDANGHHLQNRSDKVAVILEMGSRRPNEDVCTYSDIDLIWSQAGGDIHKDGRSY